MHFPYSSVFFTRSPHNPLGPDLLERQGRDPPVECVPHVGVGRPHRHQKDLKGRLLVEVEVPS